MPFGLDFFVAVDGILLVPSFGTRRVVLVVVVAAVIMAIQFLFKPGSSGGIHRLRHSEG